MSDESFEQADRIDLQWHTLDGEASIEERVRRLEALLEALKDYRAREGLRLTDSVERLGLNAGSLSEALQQVDRNQQALTQLGQELDETRKVIVPREEHIRRDIERRAELARYRRGVLRRIYAYGIATLAGVAAAAVFGATYLDQQQTHAYQACVDSNHGLQATVDYLTAVRDTSTNPALRDAASNVIDSVHPADCGSLR